MKQPKPLTREERLRLDRLLFGISFEEAATGARIDPLSVTAVHEVRLCDKCGRMSDAETCEACGSRKTSLVHIP